MNTATVVQFVIVFILLLTINGFRITSFGLLADLLYAETKLVTNNSNVTTNGFMQFYSYV